MISLDAERTAGTLITDAVSWTDLSNLPQWGDGGGRGGIVNPHYPIREFIYLQLL